MSNRCGNVQLDRSGGRLHNMSVLGRHCVSSSGSRQHFVTNGQVPVLDVWPSLAQVAICPCPAPPAAVPGMSTVIAASLVTRRPSLSGGPATAANRVLLAATTCPPVSVDGPRRHSLTLTASLLSVDLKRSLSRQYMSGLTAQFVYASSCTHAVSVRRDVTSTPACTSNNEYT